MNDSYRDTYREEALDLLSELEITLLDLENAPVDSELISKVFRALHTIKGSGAMFGFDNIAAYVHDIESVYDRIRSGEIPVTKQIINATLEAKDRIRLMLEEPNPAQGFDRTGLFGSLLIEGSNKKGTDHGNTVAEPGENVDSRCANENSEEHVVVYRIRFRPDNNILLNGTNPVALLGELDSLGDCRLVAQLEDIPEADQMNPEYCYTFWDIILSTTSDIQSIRDVFVFVEDTSELIIDVINSEENDQRGDISYKRLGEILIKRGDITEQDLEEVLREKKPIGEMLVEKGIVTSDKVESALVEQQHIRDKLEKRKTEDTGTSSIRVSAEKLDTLVNLVGELVTVQARLSQTSSLLKNSVLDAIAEEVERLTCELRDNTLNIRMLPIGTTFGRFQRLIRDLSQELSKKIELVTKGAETELDKTVIEKLSEPLMHLIRNSIDHGIESPDERVRVGKAETGTIRLSAEHSGANVVIQIKDDGKGLSREAILAKALDKGMVSGVTELSDEEISNFIFMPGFSTASEVTNVSGRGVGMDVVKKAIDRLRGSIDISSVEGAGTTITIKLPLTLAIIDGLLVSVGRDCFVLPLSFVEECVELTGKDIKKAHGKDFAHIRGDLVPYIRLRNEFSIPGSRPDVEQIVITGANGDRIGFVVDDVIGEHQTVIKSLGRLYRNVQGVSGATILGDGTLAMILDVPQLVNIATEKGHQTRNQQIRGDL